MRRICLILSLLALSVTASAAHAQAPVLATNGSTLSAPANLALPGGANQCLARPYIGTGPGQIQFINTGQSTCMWWSTQYGPDSQPVGNTYVPRGSGAVTRVRIRSGDAPAPLRFAIVSSGSGLCCTAKQISPPVQPAPNQVNQFAVDLPAGSGVGTAQGSQFNDILVVVAVGPGSLPVNDRGTHGFLFGSAANQAQASFLHPALALGESNTDVGIMDGYEVLLQYDWCGIPGTLSNPAPTPPANPQTACLGAPATPPSAAPAPAARRPAPLRTLAAIAAVRRNVAALRLRCLLATTCAGRIRLLPRSARATASAAKTYGSARYRIKPRKSATLRVKLTKAGRKALRRKRRLPVNAVISSGGTSWTLKLTLRRARR